MTGAVLPFLVLALTVMLGVGCSSGGSSAGGAAGVGGSAGVGGHSETMAVGPEGGVLRFSSGVVLDVPAGAVSEAVDITVGDLPTGDVNAIVEAREFVLSEERMLGGFRIEPHLEFNVPITGTLPIAQPEPYELLWRAEVDFESGKAWLAETNIDYDPVRGVAEVEIPHTSTVVVLGQGGSTTMPAWLAWSLQDVICSSAELNHLNPNMCNALDPLQPPCCLITPPGDRPSSCVCCRQGAANFQSNAADYSQSRASGDCEILSDQVLAQYYECMLPDGSPVPVEQHVVAAVSPNCPEDMLIDVRIDPSRIDMFVCETKQLTGTVEGVRPDGTVVIPRQEWPMVWRTSDIGVARFDDPSNGLIYAASVGFTRAFAQTGIASQPFPARAPLTVRSNVQSLSVDPSATEINILDGEILSATVTKHDGTPLDAEQVTWFSVDEGIAYVTQGSGSFTSVQGVAKGCTEVLAEYVYDLCEIVHTVVPVCVDCRRITFSVRPNNFKAVAGHAYTVTAEPLNDGIPVDASGVRWESDKVFIASPESTSGAQAQIRGIRPGQAVITATYEDDCQVKKDTTKVDVCPALAIEPGTSVLSPNDTIEITVQPVDAFGNTVPWKLEGLRWDTTTPGIVSLQTSSLSRRVTVRGLSPGLGYVRALYEGECGGQSVTAQVQVQADVLEGEWNVQAAWGEQDCYINGSLDVATTFTSDGSLTLSVEQSGPSVTAQYYAYPESEPYTGTVEATSDPLRPYDLELSIDSAKTADCIELARSGTTIYGEPVCSGCTATECFETEQVIGYVSRGGNGFFGRSTWGLTASSGNNSLLCEGEAALVGCREADPWPLFVDTPCGSTEEAELLCTDFYSPDWLYADCIPSSRDGSPLLVCVFCQP